MNNKLIVINILLSMFLCVCKTTEPKLGLQGQASDTDQELLWIDLTGQARLGNF